MTEPINNTNPGKAKIVLAEDDQFISRAYTDGLRRAGYEVVTAMDGNAAIAIIKAEKPDIILLDIIMPEKNGFEVIEEIKKDPELSAIPIIVLSNLGQDTDIQKGRDLGANDYFIKSNLSMAEVVAKVEQHLPKQ